MSVAVLIAAYRAVGTVGRAVGSALAQADVAEVVVVDDACPDGTAAAARAADDGSLRLRVVRMARNGGPGAARNVALAASTAPLVAVLDADDVMRPGRMARLLAAAGNGWDLAADDLLLADGPDEAGEAMLGVPAVRELDLAGFVAGNREDARRPGREMGFLKPLVRRDFLARHGLRYAEGVRLGEDYLLYAAALAAGARLRLVPACGYVAVRREGSLSRAHGAEDLRALAAAEGVLMQAHPAAAGVLGAHRSEVLRKYHYRAALDAKARHRVMDAARHVFATAGTAAYVLRQTLAARGVRV